AAAISLEIQHLRLGAHGDNKPSVVGPARHLHEMEYAVAARCLLKAQPVAMRVQPHRLGDDRHDRAKGDAGREVAVMQLDRHERMHRKPRMVPWRRLELPRLSALVPETSASTNSATRARHAGCGA